MLEQTHTPANSETTNTKADKDLSDEDYLQLVVWHTVKQAALLRITTFDIFAPPPSIGQPHHILPSIFTPTTTRALLTPKWNKKLSETYHKETELGKIQQTYLEGIEKDAVQIFLVLLLCSPLASRGCRLHWIFHFLEAGYTDASLPIGLDELRRYSPMKPRCQDEFYDAQFRVNPVFLQHGMLRMLKDKEVPPIVEFRVLGRDFNVALLDGDGTVCDGIGLQRIKLEDSDGVRRILFREVMEAFLLDSTTGLTFRAGFERQGWGYILFSPLETASVVDGYFQDVNLDSFASLRLVTKMEEINGNLQTLFENIHELGKLLLSETSSRWEFEEWIRLHKIRINLQTYHRRLLDLKAELMNDVPVLAPPQRQD
ncbi:hypothetical protein BJ508DRAFT_309997 [Ascobolus immersus RN42]|uniref:Uncharacterized protein n=1 Tax=Ascobolus immersus RN42 TaxID=1160509 RepID=A0A3N4HUV4_ASCIM|nr:hypothetical protein BJ508DRAFT_309997 [Ascobolus immersus RN42]